MSDWDICTDHAEMIDAQIRAVGLCSTITDGQEMAEAIVTIARFMAWRGGDHRRANFVPTMIAAEILTDYCRDNMGSVFHGHAPRGCFLCAVGRAHFARCTDPACRFSVVNMCEGTARLLRDLYAELPE